MANKKPSRTAFRDLVNDIPGEDGWWKFENKETFATFANILYGRGITDLDEIKELLQCIYDAVRSEYGD